MSKILVKGNICFLKEEADIEFIRRLDQELSFKVIGAEHTWAYQNHRWDGVNRILTRNLTFPRGLLDRVVGLYKSYNKDVKVEDTIKRSKIENSINILPKLKEMGKYPREYQFDVLDAVKNNSNGIIRAATGSGKTIISALMVAYFNKSAIIYVISKDLLHQTHGFFSEVFDQKIGMIGDGICDIQDINIASVWTVGQALGLKKSDIVIESEADNEEVTLSDKKYAAIRQMMSRTKVNCLDECHISSAPLLQAIFKSINPEYLYGMSASPWRDDGSDLLIEGVFGNKIVDISASELIKQGYLVKPLIKFIKVPKYHETITKGYQTVYKKYIIDNPVRNEKIVNGAVKLVELGYQPLISFSRINHGKILYKEISKKLSCEMLSGKDSSKVREVVKKKLENREIDCVLASTIFDIGVDLPSLSGLIVGGGGKSSVRALQRIGRIIRPLPGKKFAAVIDFADNIKYLKSHSKIRKKIYSIEEEYDITWPT
jgi:superfamily II DNA or RNA helicase